MSLPHLLLVDDSEAVLAFEKAALAGHYLVSTAVNGRDALLKVAQLRPAAVLLDLSMPEMDGDEVLARMRQDPQLAQIPVIIVSSEKQRAEACLSAGARAFLGKPIRAQDLLPLVGQVLEEARREQRAGNLAVLFVIAGGVELGRSGRDRGDGGAGAGRLAPGRHHLRQVAVFCAGAAADRRESYRGPYPRRGP